MQKLIKEIWAHVKSIQKIVISTVKKNRGGTFNVNHWVPILEEKKRMKPKDYQSREVIELYKKASRLHFDIISSMTQTVIPDDEPWTENIQAPPVVELLYGLDPGFRKDIEKFVDCLEREQSLLDRVVLDRYTGRQGPTWVNDIISTPASNFNLYKSIFNKIKTPIDPMHRETMLHAVSFARNTSYTNLLGATFTERFENGENWTRAIEAERESIKKMWLEPVNFQIELMKKLNFRSFNIKEYLTRFKEGIEQNVKECMESGVHYGNIIQVANAAGGIEHHISQMTYNMCKDDLIMAIKESVAQVLEDTLDKAVAKGKLKDPTQVPITPITGAAVAYVLQKDGFNANMVNHLLMWRSQNLYLKDPKRMQREDLVGIFMNYLDLGERTLNDVPCGNGRKVGGIEIDLHAIDENEVLQNPQRYTWAQTPITARFSALMRFVDEPMMLMNDPVLNSWIVQVIALKPSEWSHAGAKDLCNCCVQARFLPARCNYCLTQRESISDKSAMKII